MLYYKITVLLNTDPDTEKENPKTLVMNTPQGLQKKSFWQQRTKIQILPSTICYGSSKRQRNSVWFNHAYSS